MSRITYFKRLEKELKFRGISIGKLKLLIVKEDGKYKIKYDGFDFGFYGFEPYDFKDIEEAIEKDREVLEEFVEAILKGRFEEEIKNWIKEIVKDLKEEND